MATAFGAKENTRFIALYEFVKFTIKDAIDFKACGVIIICSMAKFNWGA